MVHQGFLSFSFCSSRFLSELRSAKLHTKINMVLNTCFVLRSSSILHLAFRSAIHSKISFEVVLCHSWQFHSCFMIHMLSRMRQLNPSTPSSMSPSQSINLFIGVILGQFSPKAFHWECCYLWCLSMIQAFSISFSVKEVFHLFGDLKQSIVFVSGRLSPHHFEMFAISQLQAYSFRCWFSNNLVATILKGCFPSSFVAQVVIFFSAPLSQQSIFYSFFWRHGDVALFTHHLEL